MPPHAPFHRQKLLKPSPDHIHSDTRSQTSSGQNIRNLLAGSAIFLVITLNVLAYAGRLPLWALNWPYSDKVIHFVAYAVLTLGLFARLGQQQIQIGGGSFPLGDEGLQSLSPARSLELADLLSNLAGISCAWILLSKTRCTFQRMIPGK